ncbi:hypothetical protein L596_015883 [Steinernema carpocapsae]|uniref:Uncharacterized protein n=1 Tax=Steinernema carpocapsae TaxID=34508 RepID=A0A4U5NH99_STECR|nr:hypothetical protein L596_015883 [Steinernema carpocapsae]
MTSSSAPQHISLPPLTCTLLERRRLPVIGQRRLPDRSIVDSKNSIKEFPIPQSHKNLKVLKNLQEDVSPLHQDSPNDVTFSREYRFTA